MTSNLFTQLGLGGMDIGIVLIVFLVLILILLVLLIVTISKQNSLKKRYESFMMGSNARSMEDEIRNLFYDIDYLKKESEDSSREIRHIYKRLETVFQRVGLIKYDALNQMGGKLSFALALLDEKNNGFLMNSVHSTEGSYCYVKEIRDGSCEIELSADEQKALSQALMQEYVPKPKKTATPPPPEKSERGRSTGKETRRRPRPVKAAKEDADEYTDEYEKQEPDEGYEDPQLLEAEAVIARKSRSRRPAPESSQEGVISYTSRKKTDRPVRKVEDGESDKRSSVRVKRAVQNPDEIQKAERKRTGPAMAAHDPGQQSHVSVRKVSRSKPVDEQEAFNIEEE